MDNVLKMKLMLSLQCLIQSDSMDHLSPHFPWLFANCLMLWLMLALVKSYHHDFWQPPFLLLLTILSTNALSSEF